MFLRYFSFSAAELVGLLAKHQSMNASTSKKSSHSPCAEFRDVREGVPCAQECRNSTDRGGAHGTSSWVDDNATGMHSRGSTMYRCCHIALLFSFYLSLDNRKISAATYLSYLFKNGRVPEYRNFTGHGGTLTQI